MKKARPFLSPGEHWGVAKLVKAPDFDSGMRRFESFLPSPDLQQKQATMQAVKCAGANLRILRLSCVTSRAHRSIAEFHPMADSAER